MTKVLEALDAAQLDADDHGELRLWVRRAIICLLTAVIVVALCNVVGQRSSDATVHTTAVDVTLHSPTAVRAGLLFQARITVAARVPLPKAELVLNHGFFDGLTLNTAEPAASREASRPDGSVVMSLGNLAAGDTVVQYLEYQVNPTSFSQRPLRITIQSNGTTVATLRRTLTIIP